MLLVIAFGRIQAQVQPLANFQFTLNPTSWEGGPVSGWINVQGDPSQAVISVTDPVSHITISSVSTSNWYSDDGVCAEDRAGDSAGMTYFPPLIMIDHWYQYSNGSQAEYNVLTPQLQLSGLNKDSSYILRMSASTVYDGSITQYTVAGRSVYPSQTWNPYHNTTQGVTFQNVYPDSNGVIRIYVNTTTTGQSAVIAGLQVISGSANVGTPTVAFTRPTKGTILPEGTNLVITATASETGGSIAKVEFYADTVKIAEVDNAPYTFTWNDPDPGNYTLTARATDNVGTVGSASVNIGVQSLNYFWSTTGNAATGGDSNFVGTVDSNRLSFRTKNIERMTISAIGNVGIGTDSPTAKLHTMGTVRLAGLKNDSTSSQPRMLVADTSGNLYYRNISGGVGGAFSDTLTANRSQYLNGHYYSIGGSVNDPVNKPVFRAYNNGDIAVQTTMDSTVSTLNQNGLRYYGTSGLLQLGATDRLGANRNIGPSFLINGGDSNYINGGLYGAFVAGDNNTIAANSGMYFGFLSGESNYVGDPAGLDLSVVVGYGNNLIGGLAAGLVTGVGNTISKPSSTVLNVSGYQNATADTARGSLIGGSNNWYGGLWQLVGGNFLVNRTPGGTTLGNGNVDFTTLPYTGLQGVGAAGIAGYPIFSIGNSNSNTAATRSNALTVLYNGRTQINTTGHTAALSQAAVTPKAALDVVSTNTGVLLPRLTNAQRNAIVSGDLQNGLLLYNTDSSAFQYYNGSAWNSVGSGSASGGGRWQVGGSAIFDSTDNIGIGTSNTHGFKLAVNGNAIFTNIKVKGFSAWPDYVFRKGYHLPDLKTLEKYIATHQHLPDVPAEADVKKDGQDIGATQAVLLKKVEELTLYVIDLDKKVEALQKENRRLRNAKSHQRSANAKTTK